MIEFIKADEYEDSKNHGIDTKWGWKFDGYYYVHFWSPYPYTVVFIKSKVDDEIKGIYDYNAYKDKVNYIRLINRKCKLELI